MLLRLSKFKPSRRGPDGSPCNRNGARYRAAAGAVLLLATSALRGLEITLPVENSLLRESPLEGYSLASSMCMTCHSADYILYQPRTLPLAFWKATVLKMQKIYGAPIPDSAVDPIVTYLEKTYGSGPKPAAASKT
jgi:hypothetical protein